MNLTLNLTELLPQLAAIILICRGLCDLWRYLKRKWRRPDPPLF